MSRLDRILSAVENTLAAVALGGASLLACLQVILRYLFDYTIFWAEEGTIYLLILSTFIGAVITLRHNEHVNVDVLAAFFKERGKRVLAVISALITVIYCGVFGAYAWILVTQPAALSILTPALRLPLWVVELSLPVGLTLMFLRSLEMLYRSARGRETPETDSEYGEEAAE
ncbi:MAG TPA: TRAP transporter small permease [Rubrobacteraceae bacterium]|nr:TRAP transporter small permease [Rubrobacteraceae bacterium]